MNRLYLRQARVTIARPVSFFSQAPNAIVVDNLDIRFKIEKNITKEPNSCELTIVNLAETTRFELQRRPLYVRLDAGYDGRMKRLFVGDLRKTDSTWDGPDCNTALDFGDGDRAFQFARVNRSFNRGVTARAVLQELASAMGVEVPRNARESRDFEVEFAAGCALQGRASDELDRILTPLGYGWSIQDGRLQILKPNEARTDVPLELSQDNGMVGSPEHGAPLKKGGKPILVVQNLLYPELTPGAKVRVRSREHNGLFKLIKVSHEGDTAGSGADWYTTVEALPA